MAKIKLNKKGDLDYELISVIGTIFVLAFVVIYSGFSISDANNHVEKISPNLTYQYPAIFVKSFLMLEINDDEKKDLGLDFTKDYYVYDLIYIGNDTTKNLVNDKKIAFINDMDLKGSIDSFSNFANVNINNQDLLKIVYDEISKPDLDNVIAKKNYVFYFSGVDKKMRQIYFYGGNY